MTRHGYLDDFLLNYIPHHQMYTKENKNKRRLVSRAKDNSLSYFDLKYNKNMKNMHCYQKILLLCAMFI